MNTQPTRRSRRTTSRLLLPLVSLVAFAALLGACGDDDSSTESADTSTTASTDTSAADGGSLIEVSDAWARTSPSVVTRGAVYLVITNDGDDDDALVAASVDPTVAASVELHETVASEDGTSMSGDTSMSTEGGMGEAPMSTATTMAGGSAGDGAGMMEMQPVERIEVAAGQTVALEPGGYHIMLIDLVEPLEVGTTIEVTLTFEKAGDKVVTADVRDMAP